MADVDCIAEDALLAFADGDLAGEAAAAVNAHLAGCAECRLVLSELARRTRDGRPRPSAPGAPLRRGMSLGRYLLIDCVGAGGMGVVYAAYDPELERRVALKLLPESLNDGSDGPARSRRFRHERQILASLDHPNIGALLDGGETEEGRPYLVMEYVEGLPLDQYCDGRRLSTTARLGLFRAVCAAVDYAHQHLVVHRDLKPSNILVTAEGVPKLLDFGIAKLLQGDLLPAELAATATGAQAMTPAFASPEQVRGETITTASDVYSLGVVLYELLSGQRPYRLTGGALGELLQAVCEQEPERPSAALCRTPEALIRAREGTPERLRRLLAGDVDSIVLMALRKEPGRRYASVEQLSEDIRRHLEGLPTLARRGTPAYRTVKLVRRHKASVTAIAAVFVAISWQAYVAGRARDRAERRFDQVHKLARAVLFDYHDEIVKLPGSTAFRARLVKDALAYLDSLAQEAGGDRSLQRELAEAYEKVGSVQGADSGSNLGAYASALVSCTKALAIRERLSAAAPRDEQLRLELIRSHVNVAEMLRSTGSTSGALAQYDEAVAVLGAGAGVPPSLRREVIRLYNSRGKALTASGALAKGIEDHRAAIALAEGHLRLEAHDREVQRSRAVSVLLLGDDYALMGRLDEALSSHRDALGLFEALALSDDARSQRDVAVASQRGAFTLEQRGDKEGALKLQQVALARYQAAARADPADAQAQRDLQQTYSVVAELQAAGGETGAALDNAYKGLSMCEAALALNPASADARYDLAAALHGLGELLDKSGRVREALASFERGAAIAEALSADDPRDEVRRGWLADHYRRVGDLQLRLGEPAKALVRYREAQAISEQQVAATPGNVEQRHLLALVRARLGAYFVAQADRPRRAAGQRADWQEAARWYGLSIETWASLTERNALRAEHAGAPADARRQLARCQSALAPPPR